METSKLIWEWIAEARPLIAIAAILGLIGSGLSYLLLQIDGQTYSKRTFEIIWYFTITCIIATITVTVGQYFGG